MAVDSLALALHYSSFNQSMFRLMMHLLIRYMYTQCTRKIIVIYTVHIVMTRVFCTSIAKDKFRIIKFQLYIKGVCVFMEQIEHMQV